MEVKPNRVKSYVGTLDVNSVVDVEILRAIRKSVSISNKDALLKKRVTVKGCDVYIHDRSRNWRYTGSGMSFKRNAVTS